MSCAVVKSRYHTGCAIYCYMQCIVHAVFYCLGIAFLAGMMLGGYGSTVHASSPDAAYIFTLYPPAAVGDGLEVRDSQGRIVRQKAAVRELEYLFVSRLVTLLIKTDIRSIAASQAALNRVFRFGTMMIGLPFKEMVSFCGEAIVSGIKQLSRFRGRGFVIPRPDIPILIFPGFMLLILSRKLSTVVLRL